MTDTTALARPIENLIRLGAIIEDDSMAHRLRAILPAGGVIDLTSPGGINIIGPLNQQGIDRQPKRDG